jgi:hypothetical protein
MPQRHAEGTKPAVVPEVSSAVACRPLPWQQCWQQSTSFVVLVRFMSQQMTRKTERRAEDMYDEFSSDRKDKDRYPI